jgi:Domain of unknown function (DUF4279)
VSTDPWSRRIAIGLGNRSLIPRRRRLAHHLKVTLTVDALACRDRDEDAMTTNAKRACASLRISSQARSAAQVTKIIGLPPTSFYEKGDLVSRKSQTPGYRQNSMWILESDLPADAMLDDHVDSICCLVELRSVALKTLRRDCSIDVFCGFFSDSEQAGFMLSKETIRKLAALEVDLIFDVYPGQ